MVATDLKNGTTYLENNTPYRVEKYRHQKIGRGGATVKLVVRNLETGEQKEKTYNSTHKVENISTIKKPLQYLYSDKATATFMDSSSYEQVEIPADVLGGDLKYIKEGEEVDVLFWDEKALSVDIPPKVNLKVVDTDPGVKGNSATNIYKPAELENGLKLKVPLFINKGDVIRVDTRDGNYVERIKKN
jgi:elongation factor P